MVIFNSMNLTNLSQVAKLNSVYICILLGTSILQSMHSDYFYTCFILICIIVQRSICSTTSTSSSEHGLWFGLEPTREESVSLLLCLQCVHEYTISYPHHTTAQHLLKCVIKQPKHDSSGIGWKEDFSTVIAGQHEDLCL